MPNKDKVLIISYHDAMNIGARTISSILKKNYDVSFLFFLDFVEELAYNRKSNFENFDKDKIIEFCKKYRFILISSSSYDKEITFWLSDLIRKYCKDSDLILGGLLAISEPEECLKHADFVCIWHGHTILEVLESIKDKTILEKSIPNFLIKGATRKPRYSSPDIYDKWAHIDYSVKNNYFFIGNNIIKKEKDIFFQSIGIKTTDGCVFNCSFCYNSYMNKIRKKHKLPLLIRSNLNKVISELKRLIKLKQMRVIKDIIIHDDNFFIYTKAELTNFVCKYNEYIDLPLKLIVDSRSPEFIQKVNAVSKIKQGVTLRLGIQSGSEEFNSKIYNRRQTNKSILEMHNKILEIDKNNKIHIRYYFIYANPFEEKEDIVKTINLMLQLKKAYFDIKAYSPIPHTVLWEKLKNQFGYLNTYSYPAYSHFEKFGFYYMLYFIIKSAHTMKLEFLLPNKFRPSHITDLLNNRLFSKVYYKIIQEVINHSTAMWNKHQKNMLRI